MLRFVTFISLLLTCSTPTIAKDRVPAELGLSDMGAHFFDEAKAKPEWNAKNKKLFIYVAGTHFNERWKKGASTELASGFESSVDANFKKLYRKALIDAFSAEGFNIVYNQKEADALILGNIEDVRIYLLDSKHLKGSTVNHAGTANRVLEIIEQDDLKAFLSNAKQTRDFSSQAKRDMNRDFQRLMESFAEKAAKAINAL